ncbi:Mariner Mos1 transposase [Eumeta japonica]|uniref:Mariner Mos1 transposase n=1 Tax=Eumeta variegata TaxID=151549 RepID=A0A4C2A5G7_EUMVA|nr:Mariner Mos1 transposase [Eumeta japonica]
MMHQKLFIISIEVMNLGSMHMTPKLNKSMVWVFQDEWNSSKVIYAKSTFKQTFAFFLVQMDMPLQCNNRKTVDSKWYTTIYLPDIFEEIRKNNRQHRIILHHDDVSCHTSAETTRSLEGQKIELAGHPPYSPDLALDDFYLFPSVKDKLRGQSFLSHEEAVDAFKIYVLVIPQSQWKKCYKN